MKIYTSYWAQVRNFPKNLVGLNTTVYPPKWRPLGQDKRGIWVIDCPILKPGKECEGLCNGKCDPKHPNDCAFLDTYHKQLMKINMDEFSSHLTDLYYEITEGENLDTIDFALIVFEAPTNPCSERWALQSWLRYNGIEVEEWRPNV